MLYDYPVVSPIRCIVPLVDELFVCEEFIHERNDASNELFVCEGRCEDGTVELIHSIGDRKGRHGFQPINLHVPELCEAVGDGRRSGVGRP